MRLLADERRCRIISCDPGKATGFGVFDLWYRPTSAPQWTALRAFHLERIALKTIGWDNRIQEMRETIQEATTDLGVPLVVVNEHYTVTRLTMQSQDTQSLDVTGSLTAILELLEVRHTYCEQLPSSAKMLVTDRVLSHVLDVPVSKLSDHQRDAARHALTWAVAYIHNKRQLVIKT